MDRSNQFNSNIPNGNYSGTIAMASVPFQKWEQPYDLEKALKVGTIFPELHKPFFMGGDQNA